MKKVSTKKLCITAVVISLITSIIVSFGIGLMVNDGLAIEIRPLSVSFFQIAMVLLPFFFIVVLLSILAFIAVFYKSNK